MKELKKETQDKIEYLFKDAILKSMPSAEVKISEHTQSYVHTPSLGNMMDVAHFLYGIIARNIGKKKYPTISDEEIYKLYKEIVEMEEQNVREP